MLLIVFSAGSARPSSSGWPDRRARAAGGRSTRLRASAGSPRTGRSARCTGIRRCLSAGSGPCCCSRCTRWPWPPWRSTQITVATRGADCSGPAISWPSPRSAGPMTRRRQSRGSARSTSTSPGPPPTGGRTPPPTRTCSRGCTSPRWTASYVPTPGSVPGPWTRPDATVTSPTWPGSAPRSAYPTRRAPRPNSPTGSASTGPS